MTQINAYLTFNGNCREAMNFYKECLGGELTLQTVEGTPMEAKCPTGMKQNILHSMLKKEGLVLMATDMIGPSGFIKGNAIALALNCSTAEEIKTFFSFLSKDGKIIEPLMEQFWGATFGCLTDKYGVTWLFNFDKNQTQ
jgi:PhnB protein